MLPLLCRRLLLAAGYQLAKSPMCTGARPVGTVGTAKGAGTLSRLWNTRELRKAMMDHARGPVAYANMTCCPRACFHHCRLLGFVEDTRSYLIRIDIFDWLWGCRVSDPDT